MAKTKGFYEVVRASAVTVTPRKQQISKGTSIMLHEALPHTNALTSEYT
jgi:hypothetical protein